MQTMKRNKKTENTMINIPAQFGLSQEKRRCRPLVRVMPILVLGVLAMIGAWGMKHVESLVPVEESDSELAGCIRQYMPFKKPVAILELEYSYGYEKAYSYNIMTDAAVENVNLTAYCPAFFMKKEWYGMAGARSIYQGGTILGRVLLENDWNAGFEEGHQYLLFIYERGDYRTDFYIIESDMSSMKLDSRYYVNQPEARFIERVEEGYLLADGRLVSEEEFAAAMESVLNEIP